VSPRRRVATGCVFGHPAREISAATAAHGLRERGRLRPRDQHKPLAGAYDLQASRGHFVQLLCPGAADATGLLQTGAVNVPSDEEPQRPRAPVPARVTGVLLKGDFEKHPRHDGLAVVAQGRIEIVPHDGDVDGPALEGKQGRILDVVALKVAEAPCQPGAERQGLREGRLPYLHSVGDGRGCRRTDF